MLSKVLARSKPTWVCMQLARNSSTATPSWVDGPERDLVNFPRPVPLLNPSPVRMGFLPQGWFDMFYNKTGVTGPYMLGAGLITFLMSKEIYVLDHEFYLGAVMYSFYGYMLVRFGPDVSAQMAIANKEENDELDALRDVDIAANEADLAVAKDAIASAENHATLFLAKKENVALQLEAAYRERLQQVHDEVKKRLDYQLETSNVKRRFEQKHMVEWIEANVRKSITPAVEDAALKQCIADLKVLATKA